MSNTSQKILRIATYNVENYSDGAGPKAKVKSPASKAKVQEAIRAMNPDVIALQEMGNVAMLAELRESLATGGLRFPHWEHVTGEDADAHIAVLSKLPFVSRWPHPDDSFVLNGKKCRSRRGFAEVEFQLNGGDRLILFAVHLKSMNPEPAFDPLAFRLEEARLLRRKIDAHFARNAGARLIVLGDFNARADSSVIQTVNGDGPRRLIDTHPVDQRHNDWTNFCAAKNEYSRIDYLLISQGVAANWLLDQSRVWDMDGWQTASDHRPILGAFRFE